MLGSRSLYVAKQKRLDKLVKPFIFRRLKIDVIENGNLLPKNIFKVEAVSSDLQRQLYDAFLLVNKSNFFSGINLTQIFGIIM